jgi:hypothetical protein
MADCMRFLRLGVINVLGITVPGILLIVFLSVGFFFPLAIVVLPVCQVLFGSDNYVHLTQVMAFYTSNKMILWGLILVMAYVAGYIIRLSAIDDLDRISADIILQKMNQDAKERRGLNAIEDHWPYQGEPDNKFPYFHFKKYLLFRGLKDYANLVAWGPCENIRSKTHINRMKIEVMTESPELSAVIESNEAHVRLMFGTWMAIKTTRNYVRAGTILSFFGLIVTKIESNNQMFPISMPFGLSLLLCIIILMAMQWAKVSIEHLFHYQRVRELYHIVASLYFIRKESNKDANNTVSVS